MPTFDAVELLVASRDFANTISDRYCRRHFSLHCSSISSKSTFNKKDVLLFHIARLNPGFQWAGPYLSIIGSYLLSNRRNHFVEVGVDIFARLFLCDSRRVKHENRNNDSFALNFSNFYSDSYAVRVSILASKDFKQIKGVLMRDATYILIRRINGRNNCFLETNLARCQF